MPTTRRRLDNPTVEWDASTGWFKATDPPKPPARAPQPAPWNRAREQKSRVTDLLLQAFGVATPRRASGMNVPDHMKPYVR